MFGNYWDGEGEGWGEVGGEGSERMGWIVLILHVVWYVRKEGEDKEFKCSYKFVS